MSIVSVVVLLVLLDLFVAEGQTKKYIKGIMSIVVIIVIVAHSPQLLKKDYTVADVFSNEIYDERIYQKDDSFLLRLARAQYDEMEIVVYNSLKNKGIDQAEININTHLNSNTIEISNVVVSIKNAVISEDLKNININ